MEVGLWKGFSAAEIDNLLMTFAPVLIDPESILLLNIIFLMLYPPKLMI